MSRNRARATFAQQVPEELIIYELADKSAKAFTPAAEALREFRRGRRDVKDCWARDPTAWDEYRDIFDLRYLFDDEEIWEERAELMLAEEDDEDPYWWSTDRLDDIDYYEQLKREAVKAGRMEERADFEFEDILARDLQEMEEEQPWAEFDADWRRNVRFVNGLGFVTDEYDSGHDEPNELHDPYPPVNGERFLDVYYKERRMKDCLDQLRRRARRRAYEETRELCHRWRQLAFMAIRSEPGCSFH